MKKHYLFLCLLLGLMASVRAQSTFNPKGGNRSYSVPGNGTVTITAVGGSDGSGASGGTGAFIEATFAVQADDVCGSSGR